MVMALSTAMAIAATTSMNSISRTSENSINVGVGVGVALKSISLASLSAFSSHISFVFCLSRKLIENMAVAGLCVVVHCDCEHTTTNFY